MSLLTSALRKLVIFLAAVSGLSLILMMLVTCVDVVLRKFGHPVPGAYDFVRMAAPVMLACGLPYTTAVKGHVAIEFLYRRLGPWGRIVADVVLRLLIIVLFSSLTWRFVRHGADMRTSGETSLTLQLPVFWVSYVIAFACAVVVLVTIYHVFHPGKELLKP